MSGFPGRRFLERAVLAISSQLICPPISIMKEGRRQTLRRPLSLVCVLCPVQLEVGEDTVDDPGGRETVWV